MPRGGKRTGAGRPKGPPKKKISFDLRLEDAARIPVEEGESVHQAARRLLLQALDEG